MKNGLFRDQDYNLWVLLHQVRGLIFRARETELNQYGITTMQAAVLFVLEALGGKSTPTEISKWLIREPNSVSSILVRMEKEGLLSKAKDLEKKSQVNVELTEKGRRAYSQSEKRESIREIMSCLSKEERRQLRSLLEKLREKALQSSTPVRKINFP